MDKIKHANPTITVIGSEERIKTRFMPTEALRQMKVVFADVDNGLMLKRKGKLSFRKLSENILENI